MNIVITDLAGFMVSFWLLWLAIIPSLFIAVAFTATSVGVSVGVWQEANAIKSVNGQLLVDVAEMDDISGIILMALLFSVAPLIKTDVYIAPIAKTLVTKHSRSFIKLTKISYLFK